MPIINNPFNGKLNLDVADYRISNGDYKDALNITKDAQGKGQDRVVSNILGNVSIPYSLPAGTNKVIGFYADQQPDRIALTQDNTLVDWYNQDYPLFYNYWDGYGFTNIYGYPSGSPFVGSFKIDDSNGVILLNENFYYDYLMIEYLASPDPNEKYMIPIQFREAMIAWLAWRDIANMPSTRRGNLGDKRDRKSEFYNQRRIANAQFKPLYLNEAYEWNLLNQRMTVKG